MCAVGANLGDPWRPPPILRGQDGLLPRYDQSMGLARMRFQRRLCLSTACQGGTSDTGFAVDGLIAYRRRAYKEDRWYFCPLVHSVGFFGALPGIDVLLSRFYERFLASR